MTSPPGLDLDALTRWLQANRPGLVHGPLAAEILSGGRSNLTYRVTDGSSTWALRRPPLGHALPTAHDMVREFRVTSALAPTAVPVAAPIALCEDPDVIGAQFYLMQYVDGIVLDRAEILGTLSPAQARAACEELVDTLLAIHALDPVDVGLADFGRPEGFLARQVSRWTRQWEASRSEDRPGLAALIAALADQVPEQSASGIVHGDYRLTNVMFTKDVSRIAAVVDWEMATLGDPLADVGLLVVYQSLARQSSFLMPAVTAEAGFLSAEAMVERYRAASPRDLGQLPWYVAFGYFKLAVILEGIHFRHLQGKTVGEGFDQIGTWVDPLIEAGAHALNLDTAS